MKRIILLINILNYVLCDFFENLYASLSYVCPLYWIHIIAKHKNWRKTDRLLHWFTWDFETTGSQKETVRFISMSSINNTIAFYFLCLMTMPINLFIVLITESIFNIHGYGLLLFFLCQIPFIILLTKCLIYKNRDERYIRVFDKRYRRCLVKWRIYTLLFIIIEFTSVILILR